MNFNQYYFQEENINEVNWLKSKFFSNAFRAIAGSGKRKVDLRDFKQFTELTPAGYSEMFTSLSNRYDKTGGTKSGLKNYIKNVFTAIFDPKKAQKVFPYKNVEGNQSFVEFSNNPQSQVKASSYYETNKGGRIMLVYLEDDNQQDRYYIGLDGNALKFFVAPTKQGGLGKDFRTWLAAQAASTYKPDQKTMSPEFLGKGEKESKEKDIIHTIKKIPIEKKQYKELAPKLAIAASYEYSNLFDLFTEEVLNEVKGAVQPSHKVDDKKTVTKKDGKWRAVKKDLSLGNTISKLSNLINYIAVNEKGEKDSDLQKELEKDAKGESQNQSNDQDEPKIQDYGKIYDTIKNEINGKPEDVITITKETKDAEPGFRYALKDDKVLFLYQNRNDKKYYLAFNLKAEKIANELIKKFGLEKAPETPGESILWDY